MIVLAYPKGRRLLTLLEGITSVRLRRRVLMTTLFRRRGHTVRSGPFAGMQYGTTSAASAYFAKLVGSYERELHPILEEIVALAPAWVVDVGAAEGYYAVGLAGRLSAAHIVAFEADEAGQAELCRLAALNGVDGRVYVRGTCDVAGLHDTLANADGEPLVVICDVEGYERVLLDPEAVPGLAAAWVLVELHDLFVAGVSEQVRARFQPTHTIEEVRSLPRRIQDFPPRFWFRHALPDPILVQLMNEHRQGEQTWFWMRPRVSGAARNKAGGPDS